MPLNLQIGLWCNSILQFSLRETGLFDNYIVGLYVIMSEIQGLFETAEIVNRNECFVSAMAVN
jgi:hypothetical protein